ncbi:MAG: bifunctional folylpolyglutamate synthase/dihydrofolate synthase [Saprospiraceae bacterium]|nr:bifunctional folylpolyglutamate synthase/dihydrofolate synthase [Saprospiraceae bacterium]
MFQRIGPAAFKKDLTNTLALCEHLGQPHRQVPCIHIAGTNGKGSTAHMLSAIFTAAGYKTGLYTSPHYRDFRERIKINGELMPKRFVVDFVRKHKDFAEQLKPSFFEWTVGLAFDYFAKQKVDIAIIETGLGGRLDSTNVITPLLSIITNISYDHQNMLGDTLPLIAGEKAGIIKPGVPVVIGETHPESAPVFIEKAKLEGSPIVFSDQHFEAKLLKKTESHAIYDVFLDKKLRYEQLAVNHLGDYQRQNLCTVLQAMELVVPLFAKLNKTKAMQAAILTGLHDLKRLSNFLGRWEFISQSPRVLCDSAHNEDGIKKAMEGLGRVPYEKLHFVFGTVNDKSPDKVLSYLPKDATYYFAKANIPRGFDAQQLSEAAKAQGLLGRAYTSVRRALAAAKRSAKPNDLVFVGGSIFVVAEVI